MDWENYHTKRWGKEDCVRSVVKKTQRRKDPCVLTVRQEILNYASRTENTMKELGYALIVGKIQQNLTKSYVMSAWVNFKIVIRKRENRWTERERSAEEKAVKTDTHRKRTMPQMRKTSITEWWFMPEMQGVSEKLQRQKPMRFVTFRETGLRHLLYMWQKSNNEREKGVR